MDNNNTGQGNSEPLRVPAKKVWKSPELVVISVNDDKLRADTWPGSGGAGEQSKAPAFYKRVKAALLAPSKSPPEGEPF